MVCLRGTKGIQINGDIHKICISCTYTHTCVYIYTHKEKNQGLKYFLPCFVHLAQQECSAGPTCMLGALFMTLLQRATVS